MGFLDNLKEIADGLTDVVSAPIGLVWDTARAVTSSKYNPGWTRWGEGVEQGLGGVMKIGEGIGAADVGRALRGTGIGEGIKSFVHEAELLYNTEYQTQTGQAPWGLREFGVDPGSVSMARALGTVTGAAGSLLQPLAGEGAPDVSGALQAWRRAADASPGQALVEGMVDFHNKPKAEQEQIQASIWYNLISGTTDAVARWFTDPTVIMGKGVKTLRNQMYTFEPVKRLTIASRDIKRMYGVKIGKDLEEIGGVRFAKMEPGSKAYVVMRNSTVGAMRKEGSLKISDPDADQYLDLVDVGTSTQYVNSQNVHASLLSGDPKADVPPSGVQYAGSNYRPVYLLKDQDEAMRYASALHKKSPTDMPVILEIDTDGLPIAVEGLKDPTGATTNGFFTLADQIPEGNARLVRPPARELDPAERINTVDVDASSGEVQALLNREAPMFPLEWQSGGELSTHMRRMVFDDLAEKLVVSTGLPHTKIREFLRDAFDELGERTAHPAEELLRDYYVRRGSLLGALQERFPDNPQKVQNMLRLFDADFLEVWAVNSFDPSDLSRMLRDMGEDPDTTTLWSEMEDILMESTKWERGAGSMEDMLMASGGMDPSTFEMSAVDRYQKTFDVLNAADAPTELKGFEAWKINRENNEFGAVAASFEGSPPDVWDVPQGSLDSNLYAPDGSPWEPDDIIHYEEFADDLDTTLRLGAVNRVEAEKFVNHRLMQRQQDHLPEGGNFYDLAMNSRVIQQYINAMTGKDALSIRSEFFPNNPMGPMLSHLLADAKTYSEKRTILMAGMGFKMPEFQTLAPMIKAKLNRILDEFERVKNGGQTDERLRAMLGEQNQYADTSPSGLDNAVRKTIEEMEDKARVAELIENLANTHPIQELRYPFLRRYTGAIRRTSFYQHNTLARPIRVVAENKARQWINTRDAQSDWQIKRQLEEAFTFGITKDDVNRIWGRYTTARTDQHKERIVAEMETLIITKAAKKAGMSKTELEEVMRQMRKGKGQAQEYLNSRRYASGENDVVPWADPDTGELVLRPMPMLSTQASPWIALMNVDDVKRAASSYRRLRQMGMLPAAALEQFNQIWKPTVLLRGGWPLRVVSDEQLRILALQGSLLKHLAAIEAGGRTKPVGIFQKDLTVGQRTAEAFSIATLTRPLTSVATLASTAAAKAAKAMGRYDEDWWKYLHGQDIAFEKFVSSRAGFGGPDESTLHSMQALLGRDEFTLLDHLYTKGTGQWRSVPRDDPLFANSWARVLADQYGRDPLGREVIKNLLVYTRKSDPGNRLSDADFETVRSKVVTWLDSTPQGREISARMPWRANNKDKWVTELIEELDGYTAHFDPKLMDGALNNKVTRQMLESVDERLRPDVVHGEVIAQTLGTSPVMEYIKDTLSTGFDLLGRLPTDTLSRQPLFKHLYANEMIRSRDLHIAQGLDFDEAAITGMSMRAREQAIITTRQYLYDLAETSRFGHMVRFFMPFYPAWQEVMKVWGTFAINDPSVIARGAMLWQAPNKAGLIQKDENGEEFLQFRLSEKAADSIGLTGWSRYVATGGIRFGKSSFNIALNSPLPSVGPLIQMPLNEIVKSKPSLENSLKFFLPFGVNANNTDMLLSPLIRSFRSILSSPQGDHDYQQAFTDAVTWMDVEYRAGKRTTPVTVEEAHDVAKKLTIMRLISRLTSPAQPIFDSPLKPYIDEYRQLIDEHGAETADEIFLNEFGNEFFAVTLSRTVSETGIPPTVEAEDAREQHLELIQRYPEYGRLILGDEALGEFSGAAFARQVTTPVDPTDPFAEPERTYREPEIDPRTGLVMDIDRRIGWQEYIKAMDQIDLYRKQMGLPNLRVAEAEPLRQAVAAAKNYLAVQYPAWWDDFNTRDELKWDARMDAFRAITKDPLLQDRADIQGLATYLQTREIIVAELNRRKQIGGSATLEAAENQDLVIAWEQAVQVMMDDNIAFQPLYYRYLEGDPLKIRLGPEPSG